MAIETRWYQQQLSNMSLSLMFGHFWIVLQFYLVYDLRPFSYTICLKFVFNFVNVNTIFFLYKPCSFPLLKKEKQKTYVEVYIYSVKSGC